MEKIYILLETERKDAAFLLPGKQHRYFEIKQIKSKALEKINVENFKILVQAIHQQDAFNKFRLKGFPLLKRSIIKYEENKLIL